MSVRQHLLVAWVLFRPFLAAAPAQALPLPMAGALPAGACLTEVGKIEPHTPFAVNPSGTVIAFQKQGLRLRELASGSEQHLHPGLPSALGWTPDGRTLAAAFIEGEKTTLRLFAEGKFKAETKVQGRVSGLAWQSEGSLLALVIRHETFRFGTRLTEVLARWDGKSEPDETTLCDTTMVPGTAAKWGASFGRSLTFALSPLQDEILYARLHNPPAYDPHIKVMLRHLDSGQERLIAEVSLLSGGGRFNGRGDRVLVGDGLRTSRGMDPWESKDLYTLPVAGGRIALSYSGRTSLLDGKLYREGDLIATFPEDSQGVFSPSGDSLWIAQGGRLYRVSGLADDPGLSLSAGARDRLRQWRKWLSEGLITHAEYAQLNAKGAP